MLFYELHEKILALEASGKRIIKLNVGHTALPSPEVAINGAMTSLKNTKSAYGSAKGYAPFLNQIAERENVSVDHICVGPGSKQLLFALCSIFSRNRKRLLTVAPYWPAYNLIADHLNLEFESVHSTLESNWALPEMPLAKNSFIVLCNPGNPTSTLYSYDALANLAFRAHELEIPLVIDEPYRDISFTPIETIPRAIRIRSFSKEFNMEGFRLGYCVADPEITKAIVDFNQITVTCVPQFVQEAGLHALKSRESILKKNRDIWLERLEYLSRSLLDLGFSFAKPQAGMYVFASHPTFQKSGEFCLKLLQKGVAVAPGESFGDFKNFVRISASEDIPVLKEAVLAIQETLL